MRRTIEIGLLYSRTSSYALIGEASRAGALAAVAAVNTDPTLDLRFVPIERDPGGNADRYGRVANRSCATARRGM